jgi:hypothetical protein
MAEADLDINESLASRRFAVAFAVLFAFWTAVAVCVIAVVTGVAWDARDDGTAAPRATATEAAPSPTATPDERPAGVPASAAELDGDFDSGVPEQHILFSIECAGDVLSVITTDERVFAETPCPPRIERAYIEPFLGDRVRITIVRGELNIVTTVGERLTFPVGRAWIQRPSTTP